MTSPRSQLETAVARARQQGESVELAVALHRLASLERSEQRTSEALRLWEEAIQILRDAGEELQLAHKVRHLGDLHAQQRQWKEAGACYDEALAIYRDHPRASELDHANAVRPAALLKERLGQTEESLALWRRARDLYAASGVQDGIEECDQHIAQLG